MIKTVNNTLKQDKEKYQIPGKVQDIIPVRTVYPDGIFLSGKGKYSKTFRFRDINYAVASRSDKEMMFLEYSELLNAFDSGATTKITINNRRLNRLDFENQILIGMKNDGLNEYRKEYNSMLLDKATGSNAIVQDKYVTVSVSKNNIEDARVYFSRIGADLVAHFARLGSQCTELDAEERLRIIHDFFRTGEETYFNFDMKDHMKKGHSFADYICPDSYENHDSYFKIGGRYGRVLLLRDYASYIKDSMVAELTDINRNLMLSIDVIPVPTDEAVKEVENRLLGVETNITNWQRKQNMNNNYSAVVPYDMEQQRKESKEFLDDLTTRDQRMMFAVVTIVHTADSKKQLDNDTEEILTTARKHLCQMTTLRYQQLDGLQTAVPFGVRKIDAFRTLTTESLAVFMPFRVQEVYDKHGIYYGQNVISKNMMIADRRKLLNGNSFILGVSGSGKSFTAKNEITNLMLSTDADIIILDPEREYSPLVRALGGSVIEISATSPNHINAMDMNKDYGEVDPVIEKSQFLQSLCEQIIAGHHFAKGQQSIIDRCTENVYRYYKQGNYMGTPPTLADFRDELLRQPEPEAHSLALELELFTRGSLNTFAKQTNVDTGNRLICYDILELGEQLRAIGMLVILDSIINRITANRMRGKETFIVIDEIYLLFMHEYSAQFLFKLWKRVRKYGAFCTGVTQNVDDLLQSHTARTMLSNSEFIVMLNQAATDRVELAKLLNISDLQLSYITNVDAGHGLIKVGSSLVPFANKFPRNTKLYRLMSTKPGEEPFDVNKYLRLQQ
ncbi:VirB4-like conjugal transfer ATPase, CD1110 family [Hornefia butyriciproducens]|uniref:VirB4-like conjugal transfer ATPase, CD1110 family n=1 Tax=Hornefia butyriciproducens TaxID=2652293 RepID=UPI003F8AB042